MRLDDARPSPSTLSPVSGGRNASAGAASPRASGFGFKLAWNDANPNPNPTTTTTTTTPKAYAVQPGDNMVGIVRQHAQAQGVQLSDSQALRFAQNLAAHNGMPNANRIHPGQQLNLQSLTAQWQNAGAAPAPAQPASTAAMLSSQAAQHAPAPKATPHHFSAALPNRASNATIPRSSPQANPGANSGVNLGANSSANPSTYPSANPRAPVGASVLSTPHPVLDKTLDRAVSKGFIPANEKQAVYQKVLQMASKHSFAPDDFARMTLMESDGMNPKASNQRCHGIIQFCDGPARGAAAVGMASNPKSILGLSVYQQLHLTDTYFQKAGLNKQQGNVPLDDLYLSVLQPAARSETRPDVPLGIPGTQAGALYTDKNNSNAITRQSLIRGLVQNAQRVLGLDRADVKRPDNRAQTPGAPLSQAAPAASIPAAGSAPAQQVASYASTTPTQTLR